MTDDEALDVFRDALGWVVADAQIEREGEIAIQYLEDRLHKLRSLED